jgi:hypothetical protein
MRVICMPVYTTAREFGFDPKMVPGHDSHWVVTNNWASQPSDVPEVKKGDLVVSCHGRVNRALKFAERRPNYVFHKLYGKDGGAVFLYFKPLEQDD